MIVFGSVGSVVGVLKTKGTWCLEQDLKPHFCHSRASVLVIRSSRLLDAITLPMPT